MIPRIPENLSAADWRFVIIGNAMPPRDPNDDEDDEEDEDEPEEEREPAVIREPDEDE